MAPKRSARPPPPPARPPPPPAASAEETDSGSSSEEEDEEEEIAHSPPPAAPRSTAPPQHKDNESESSDENEDGEEEDDGEEEEDNKANRVIPSSATKNPPPPPPPATLEESESSEEEDGEDEDGEKEDDGEEEEDEKATRVIPSSATKTAPPPPPPAPAAREESDSSEEEEEADEEVPQTKPPSKQNVEVKGAKRQAAPFQRIWSIEDEFRILEALAAHRLKHGTLPQTEVLANAVAGKLDNSASTLADLKNKVRSMQTRHTKLVKRGAPPSKDQDRRLFDLGKNVWPSATKVAVVANSDAGGEPAATGELYPYLAEELTAVEKEYPGLFKRAFAMIDDSTALALDKKIKKQRREQMKLQLRHIDLIKESTKALTDLTK